MKTTFIDRWLAKLFPGKTFEQQLSDALAAEQALITATRASIRRKQFDLHMSVCRVEALNAWRHNTSKEPSQ